MIFAYIAIFGYLLSALFIIPMLIKANAGESVGVPNQKAILIVSSLAIFCHLISLHNDFFNVVDGENFTLFNVSSLISLIMALLLSIAMIRINTLWFLLPIIYCFAVVNIIAVHFFPSYLIRHLIENTGLLLHIAFALLAYAVCSIATLYAGQLIWIKHNLKSKKIAFSSIIPPLMAVERHFFRILLSGEILLSLTLISGAIYLADYFAAQNIQKAIFSFMAWVAFGVLLIGHWQLHWRGKRVLIYTILGMVLLTIAYFGSRAGLITLYY